MTQSKILSLGTFVLALASGCNTPTAERTGTQVEAEATQDESAEASGAVRSAPVRRELGGNVIVLGEYQAELAVHQDGLVRALVYDTQGKHVSPERVKLNLALNAAGGLKPALALGWNDTQHCLRGKADVAAGLTFAPIQVSLDVDGKAFSGTLSDYVLLPAPRFGGSVLAAGGYGVELVAKPELVSAYVFDANGQAAAKGDLDLKLRAGVGASDLALKWDAPSASYRAALDGKLDLAALPLRLTLSADGKVNIGAAMSLKAIAEAQAGADAQLANIARADVDIAAPTTIGVGLKADVNGKLKGAADLKAQAEAKAFAAAKAAAEAKATADAKAKAAVKLPSVKASASKSASAKAGTGGVKANAKASFGFGTR